MKLPRKTKDISSIAEGKRDLYTVKKDKDGNEEYHLTEIDNHDDYEIIRSVRSENAAFRTENKKFKEQHASFEGLDLEKYTTVLAENEALKAEKEALGGKDQKAIDKAVEARLAAVTAPLQLKLKTFETELTTVRTKNEEYVKSERQRTIDDHALSAFTELGVEKWVYTRGSDGDDADGLAWARRNAVIGEDGKVTHKSGLALKDALVQMRDNGERGHWFGGHAGAGSGGGSGLGNTGTNPWSADGWNFDKQCEIQLKDPQRANQLAAAAGVDVNAAYHPKKGIPEFSQY